MNIENLVTQRGLSKRQATKIANSQFDLGLQSKKDMIECLRSQGDQPRIEAFKKLDSLSQMIVVKLLDEPSIEESETSLQYTIDCLTRVKNVLSELQE